MTKQEIQNFVSKYKHKDWYYYFNFGGVKVRPELSKVKDCGMSNWNVISPIIHKIVSLFSFPIVLDIGCNMGLYGYLLSKYKENIRYIGVDKNIDHALFFNKYLVENESYEYDSKFMSVNIMENKVPIVRSDIVMMMCVIYHLSPKHDFVIEQLPDHEYLVLQGNLPRLSSKKRNNNVLAGISGMKNLMKKHGYSSIEVHDFNGYSKPLVIGHKN